MKHFFSVVALVLAFTASASAEDRPFEFTKLPKAAREFVAAHFPDVKVSYATVDDDWVNPDYTVVLTDGTKIGFEHCGSLEKVETRTGQVPYSIVPVQITDYVKAHYPDSRIVEYEVKRTGYEVGLSNRLELKFDSRFAFIRADD